VHFIGEVLAVAEGLDPKHAIKRVDERKLRRRARVTADGRRFPLNTHRPELVFDEHRFADAWDVQGAKGTLLPNEQHN
jgi:hypothetical protein